MRDQRNGPFAPGPSGWVVYDNEDTHRRALKAARTRPQRALLDGRESLRRHQVRGRRLLAGLLQRLSALGLQASRRPHTHRPGDVLVIARRGGDNE